MSIDNHIDDDDVTNDNTDDQMSAEQLIGWINSRRSIGTLNEPAPNHEQIRSAIGCAATAPDHKKLRPWRFIVTEGEARHQLGQALVAAAQAKAAIDDEELSEKTVHKTANLPLRAPVIITVVTQMQENKKVPPFEQMLSAGSAVQNLILALKAQGFSTVWRTGLLCNEPAVKAYFGIGEDDYVTAFVYTGTSPVEKTSRKPIDIETLLRFES
ncbi:nitroreductase [Psychrobacter sp. M13]|uniref:nitroreductase family protein n=1 Tax=Psychrobacter sp. M13 TaxID=3067275 RepID=UPI00273CEC6F|nr:nitroreductase [Psychrobacter sp. M13]WLP93472.1 nitroreductase [Psychrobacter sp. M13]